jgi:hypothetical protein
LTIIFTVFFQNFLKQKFPQPKISQSVKFNLQKNSKTNKNQKTTNLAKIPGLYTLIYSPSHLDHFCSRKILGLFSFVREAMRLRTSTKANHLKEEASPEPSTSRYGAALADSLRSSLSPKNSRVAKSNARLLNGLDLGGAHNAGGYSADSLVGTIPDFAIRRLQDFCPTIGQVLDEEHELDDGLLVSF